MLEFVNLAASLNIRAHRIPHEQLATQTRALLEAIQAYLGLPSIGRSYDLSVSYPACTAPYKKKVLLHLMRRSCLFLAYFYLKVIWCDWVALSCPGMTQEGDS